MYNINEMKSKDINNLLETLDTNISNIYADLIDKSEEITNLEKVNLIESQIFYNKIKDLNIQLENARNYNFQNLESATQSFSMVSDNRIMNHNITIMDEYRVATVPHKNSFGLNLSKFNREILLQSVRIEVNITSYDKDDNKVGERESFSLYDDLSLINIFDLNDSKVWIHEKETGSNVEKLEYEIKIYLPKKLIPTDIINNVNIKPFPIYQLDINKLSIGNSIGETNFIDTPILGAGNIKKNFINTQTNYVSIKLTQSNYQTLSDKKKFIIGLRSIDINHSELLTSNPAYMTLELSTQNANNSFNVVSSPITYSSNNMQDCISYELYSNQELTNEFLFGKIISGDFPKMYVKVLIKPVSSNLPLIDNINISYSTR